MNASSFPVRASIDRINFFQCLDVDAKARLRSRDAHKLFRSPVSRSGTDNGARSLVNAAEWRSILDIWRERCAEFPEQIALEDGRAQWTYRDLEQRVNAWAATLSGSSPGPGSVAIHLTHDAEAVAAMIGVLAAGRPFVALDRTHPISQRVEQINLCDVRTVICCREDEGPLRQGKPDATFITPESVRPGTDAPRANIQADSIAYFPFTSGSSGKPKAVASPHRTLAAGASIFRSMLAFDSADRHALLSPLALPASAAQVLGVLSAGATLCLFEARANSIDDLAGWLTNQQITTIQTVPSLLRRLTRHASGRKLWPALRAVKLGGESAFVRDAELFTKCASDDAAVVNGLAMTEANFNVCWFTWRCDKPLAGEFLPIGRPPPSVEIIVESAPGCPVQDGEIGEIVVRSQALPSGYWNDPDATASVYRELLDRPGWRELRTGDAGRWRSDGLLEYAGRLDDMVKVRGHRIIPAEVEAALSTSPGVEAAAVVAWKNSAGNALHAFVQLRSDAKRDSRELRKDLAAKLPAYMLPGQIHFVESLPRLPNGKVDRIRLSEKATEAPTHRELPPGTPDLLTHQLLNIWQGVFGSKQIGTDDDFFALGGDSLTAATLLAAVQKFLGIDLPSTVLLEAPTIDKLAGLIRNGGWHESNVGLVALRLGGNRPPLYCIPGAGSDAAQFRVLANHLHDDQPVLAFQPRGLDGRSDCQRSIEEVAQLYIDLIRQYPGPYYLCGSSFGGVVAFEMARRLLAAGDEVKFLGLFDSYGGKYPKRRQRLGLRKSLRFALRYFLPLDKKHIFTLSSFSRGLMHWGARRLVDLGLFLNVRAPRRPYKLRFFYLEEVCLLARQRYQPKSFHGKIHLFRAEHQPPSDLFQFDPVLGWGGMATGGIEIHELPGYHRAYLWEPGVAVLAKKLTSCLAAAASSNVALDSRSSPMSNEHQPAISIGA